MRSSRLLQAANEPLTKECAVSQERAVEFSFCSVFFFLPHGGYAFGSLFSLDLRTNFQKDGKELLGFQWELC